MTERMTERSRREMLQQILFENPADVFARYGLAMEFANAGETEAALAEFNTLLKQHPDYSAGYHMAGQTLLRAGRPEEAAALLRQGVAAAARTGNRHAQNEMQALLDEIS